MPASGKTMPALVRTISILTKTMSAQTQTIKIPVATLCEKYEYKLPLALANGLPDSITAGLQSLKPSCWTKVL